MPGLMSLLVIFSQMPSIISCVTINSLIINVTGCLVTLPAGSFATKFTVYVPGVFRLTPRVSSDKLTTTIAVRCAADDAYYWALQFGGIVEVLQPQKLRERLRATAEEMVMRYTKSDSDKYSEAIRNAQNSDNSSV